MVTLYEDKHSLLQNTLCGQNVRAGGTHSYRCVLKVAATKTRTQSVFFKGAANRLFVAHELY